jgi:serine/threonine-protein kinase
MSGTHPPEETKDTAEAGGDGLPVTAPGRASAISQRPVSEYPAGTIIGGYRIITPIGAGGMARVFLADDEQLERKVALKLLPPEDADDEARARFLREARALARVDHPHVVHVFASGIDGETAWMALEYIEGDPLSDLIGESGLDEEMALSIIAQTARGLSAVHAEGVVHRDIKPDNLLLDDAGLLRIVDFGIALVPEPEGRGGFVTRAGIAVGTPHYMAPEQARGGRVDFRADAWALGATLYVLLAGRPPFWSHDDEPDLDILARVLRDAAPDVRERAPVSKETAALVARLLEPDADARLSDVEEVASLCEELADLAMARAESDELDEPAADADEGPLADEAVETAPAPDEPAEARIAPADPPEPSEPGVMARGILLLVFAVLIVGAALVGARAVSSDTPAPDTAAPPVKKVRTTATLPDHVDPSTLVWKGPTPSMGRPLADKRAAPPEEDAGAAAVEVVVPVSEQVAALEAQASGGDAAAIQSLLELESAEATRALARLVLAPEPVSGALLDALEAAASRRHLAAVERALYDGSSAHQRQAVRILSAVRNIPALEMLRRASERHPDAQVRDSARRASRSIFQVEGEEE